MQVPGTFRPPSIGIRVDPYPISGPGTIAITDGALHVEGGRGIPWQVEVGGMAGLLAGVALTWLVLRHVNMTLTLIGLMACISAGCGVGYRLAGSRMRARHQVSFAPSSLVGVTTVKDEVQITISFRKRWQTRKQCLHFRPEDPGRVHEACAAIEVLLANRSPESARSSG